MAKKKLNTDLPYYISNYYVNRLINEIDSVEENEIEISWLSLGGSVWSGWQLADFLQQSEKEITARVTGIAASMGGVLLAYFDKVVGAKQADIMIHSTYTNVGSIRKRSNQQLYDVLKKKINEDKFKEIVGQSLKDVMFLEGEERRDVWLSGQQAYEIGLFDELIDLTPQENAQKEAMLGEMSLAANLDYELPEHIKDKYGELKKPEIKNKKEKVIINKNSNKMTIEELKAQHPAVYAQLFELGKTAGVKAEKDRVNTWLVFNDLDGAKVKAGIEGGESMTEAEKLSFLRLSSQAELQKGLENSSPDDISPDKEKGKLETETSKTNEEKAADAALDEILGEEKKEV